MYASFPNAKFALSRETVIFLAVRTIFTYTWLDNDPVKPNHSHGHVAI